MQHVNSFNSSLTTDISPGNLAASAVLGLCFALGLPGNIAVIVRLVGWLKGGSFTPRLMLSLAVSDLLTLLPLPLWIWALLHEWIFSSFLCKFLSYMVYWNLYSSVLSVTLLSVQRYMQVLHPQRWAKLGAKGHMGLVGGVWIVSGVVGSYGAVQYTSGIEKDGRLHCRQHYQTDTERVATLLWETIILFIVSFPLLVFFYFRLNRKVKESAFFKSQRMTKVVTRIVVAFFIFWLPLHIINIVLITALLLRQENLLRFAESASNIVGALTFINSCVNPFLYAFPATAQQQCSP